VTRREVDRRSTDESPCDLERELPLADALVTGKEQRIGYSAALHQPPNDGLDLFVSDESIKHSSPEK
jgi:hypothetical protein